MPSKLFSPPGRTTFGGTRAVSRAGLDVHAPQCRRHRRARVQARALEHQQVAVSEHVHSLQTAVRRIARKRPTATLRIDDMQVVRHTRQRGLRRRQQAETAAGMRPIRDPAFSCGNCARHRGGGAKVLERHARRAEPQDGWPESPPSSEITSAVSPLLPLSAFWTVSPSALKLLRAGTFLSGSARATTWTARPRPAYRP